MIVLITLLILFVYIYLGWKKPGIALMTCPFVAGTLVVIGYNDENPAGLFGAPVVFFATLAVILLSKRDIDKEQWPRIFVKFFLYLCLGVVLLAAIVVFFGPLGYFGVVFTIIFIGSIISYGLTTKHATASYVISTIGSSIRQNLPLPMALESAASGQTDNRSMILQRIKKWLVQGYPLSESIKRGYPGCPGHAVAMIAAAERINQLPLAIKAIEANMAAQAKESRKIKPVHPFYPVIVLTFMFFVLGAVMLFIVPQVEAVLAEMTGGGELPAITRFIFGISKFIALNYGWLLFAIILVVLLVLVPIAIYARFRPRRPDKPYLASIVGDFLKWHLPVLHWFERNYSMVQVVEMLRLSLNAGCSVNDAIRNTIGLDVNNSSREHLRSWLEKVERGDNIAVAARQSKLGSALAWAFDEQVNQGNTLTILESLEGFYRSNYSYCVNLAKFIMWPCLILLLGLIVGTVVLAIFSPGVAIISALTGAVMP